MTEVANRHSAATPRRSRRWLRPELNIAVQNSSALTKKIERQWKLSTSSAPPMRPAPAPIDAAPVLSLANATKLRVGAWAAAGFLYGLTKNYRPTTVPRVNWEDSQRIERLMRRKLMP